MAPKKSKGKKGGKNAAQAAEAARLAQLRQLEAEAEEFQRVECERRRQNELEEQMAWSREEQMRLIHEKERRIAELNKRVSEATAALQDDRLSYESQIEQLCLLRDSLLGEVSLLKAENSELQLILSREREITSAQIKGLRTSTDVMRSDFTDEVGKLRAALQVSKVELTEQQQQVQQMTETKVSDEQEHLRAVKELERELDKALSMNKALQQAVESHEADDSKNTTLLLLLRTQLEEEQRHYETRLSEERGNTVQSKENTAELEAKWKALQESHDALRCEHHETKLRSATELHEHQQLLEQAKFDAEYLRGEVTSMRAEMEEAVKAAEARREAAEVALEREKVEVAALSRANADLEALARRRDREHFDKVTFLNAQIANNRAAITQLQQKLDERDRSHAAELECHTATARETVAKLNQQSDEEQARAVERLAHEQQLLSQIASLKATLTQMQESMALREANFNDVCAGKDAENVRLRDILDAHFIPNRKDVEGIREESMRADEVYALKLQLVELKREMTAKEQAANETEAWLQSRIANQAEVIESLQTDLKQFELRRCEEVQALEEEVHRLRKTLDIHFIPCS